MLACLRFLVDAVGCLFSLVMILIVRGYQLFISPWLGKNCRYEPTCSQYMIQAIKRYGPFYGFYKGVRRMLRCHPWSDSGWDPP